MGSVTSQKSRRRLDSYMEKCSIPRLFISQSKIEPTTHVPVIDGMQCTYDPYASVRCATEDSYIDYTITVYDRADTVTDLQTGTVNTIVPTDYYFIGNQIAIPHGGKVRFDLKSRKEGYLDSSTYTSYIYNSRQKLVLNVTPNTTQPNDPYIFQNVGTCTMDTGSITEDVRIRFNTSFGTSSMPEAPLMPMSQTDGTLYAGTFSLPALDLSTYYAFTAKAFSISGSMDDSDPVTVYYIVRASAPQPPEFTPRPGNFTSEQQVSITDPSGACSIIYTTDGTTPSIDNGSYYTNPILVNHTTTIKAICRVPGSNIVSQVATGTYNIEQISNIRILQPYPITSTSATLIGVLYNSVATPTIDDTGFVLKSVGGGNTYTVYMQNLENYTDEYGSGIKFTTTSGTLQAASVWEVYAFTNSTGSYIRTNKIQFSTLSSETSYLYSVSPTEMVEMAKVNLSFFRLYSYTSGKKAHHNDLKQYGRCGSKIVFRNQWDYIGDKSYNIQMQAQRRTQSTTGSTSDATVWETFTVPANNTTAGSLGEFDSSNRAESSGGEVCRDLFGWGTSGNGEKNCSPHAVSYYPFATNNTSSDYYAYDNPQADLLVGGNGGKLWADWSQVKSYGVTYSDGSGPINPIDGSFNGTQSDGGTRVELDTMCFPSTKLVQGWGWGGQSTRPSKTLSYYEMDYMLGLSGSNYRQTSSGHRFAKGRIVHNNSFINGLIIFSDRYTTDMNGDITITRYDDPTAPYSTNTIDSGKWLANLDNVATFLPAAGERHGTSVQQSGQKGVYWTRTSVAADETKATALVFTDSDVQLTGVYKFHGGSVRLCGKPDFGISDMHSVSVNFRFAAEYAPFFMEYITSGDLRIEGTGSYESGTTCTLELVDNASVVSDVYWVDANSGTTLHHGGTYSFTVTRDIEIYAVVDPRIVTIQASVRPSGCGSVQGAASYQFMSQVTLLAEPNDGYEFVNWTEGQDVVCQTQRYVFTATQNRTLVANFAPVGFNISVTPNPSNGGSITGSGSYSQGQTCQLTATAGPGYEFSRWAESGSQISTSNPYSFSVSGSRDIVCDFNVSRYDITPVATTGGTVTGAQSNITYGTPVQLTATPSSGYWFKNWTLSSTIVSTDPVYEFLASQTATYTANFSLPVEITALSSGIYSQMSNGDSLYVLMYNTIRARYYANTSPSTTTSGSTIPASITSSQVTAMTTNGYIFKITRYNSASFYIQNVNNLYLYSNSGGSLRISNVNKTRWYPTDYDSSNGWFFRRAGSGATYRLRGSSTTTLGCSSTDSFNRWKLYQVSNIIKNS